MLVADKKKKESITDYLLFIYQTEDLIRQSQFDIKKIDQYIASHYNLSGEERDESKVWYQGIMGLMREQQIIERGHLEQTHEYIKSLASLSMELLKVDKEYRLLYDNAKIYIQRHLDGSNGSITSPITTCLKALYDAFLARQKGEQVVISQEDITSCQEVMAYLSYKYKQRNSVQAG